MPIFARLYDVVVAGGGPAGFGAALAAARSGARTLLVERYNHLGGMASTGLPFLKFNDASGQRIFGIPDEFVRRAIKEGYTQDELSKSGWIAIDREGVKFLFQQMLLEAGVDLLLSSWVEGVEVAKDGRIRSLVVICKGGSKRVRGRFYVDCTGDGDVAALSGVPCRFGREDGKTMGMSLLFAVGNVDVTKFLEAVKGRWPQLVRESGMVIPEEIKRDTFLDETRFMPFVVVPSRPGEIVFNWVQQVLDRNPLDPEGLSLAQTEALSRIHMLFTKVMRPYVPGCEKAYIVETASQMGIRESRRIIGKYTLTEDDCRQGRDFPDTVALCTYPFDLHASSRKDGKNVIIDHNLSGPIKIPYRVMVPAKGPSNLLVAGRSVSADRMALSSIRVMVPCMCMGEAAGHGAAMAACEGKPAGDVDIGELRSRLDLRY